jgi:hypothetical protein
LSDEISELRSDADRVLLSFEFRVKQFRVKTPGVDVWEF